MIRALSVLFLTLALIVPAPVRADDLSARIAAANAYLARGPGTVGYVLRDRSTGAAYRNPNAGRSSGPRRPSNWQSSSTSWRAPRRAASPE